MYELKDKAKKGETRMSCQIKISEEMEGAVIEIPTSAFALFDNDKDL